VCGAVEFFTPFAAPRTDSKSSRISCTEPHDREVFLFNDFFFLFGPSVRSAAVEFLIVEVTV